MMDVHWTYCDNHFVMYVNQIMVLYILNLHSATCQLYLNKTERKNIYSGRQTSLYWQSEWWYLLFRGKGRDQLVQAPYFIDEGTEAEEG